MKKAIYLAMVVIISLMVFNGCVEESSGDAGYCCDTICNPSAPVDVELDTMHNKATAETCNADGCVLTYQCGHYGGDFYALVVVTIDNEGNIVDAFTDPEAGNCDPNCWKAPL